MLSAALTRCVVLANNRLVFGVADRAVDLPEQVEWPLAAESSDDENSSDQSSEMRNVDCVEHFGPRECWQVNQPTGDISEECIFRFDSLQQCWQCI